MGSIEKLTDDAGHAAQERPASRASGFTELSLQGARMELDILRLIEADPPGAARAWIGRAHLQRYGFLLGTLAKAEEVAGCQLFSRTDAYGFPNPRLPDWNFPYEFELADVLLESKWILAQMVAEDCWCGDGEAEPDIGPETPFTTDAFIGVYMGDSAGEMMGPPPDPFAMSEEEHHRAMSGLWVEMPGKKAETYHGDEPPPEGFKEV